MRILFLTIPTYDYLGDSLLSGLRELYGDDCVDFPRKSIMYGEVPAKYLYGRGFTIWSKPLKDIRRSPANFLDIDLVIYSNVRRQRAIDWRVLVKDAKTPPRVVYLDGNDDRDIEPGLHPYYKRELESAQEGVFPISFSIPKRHVRSIDLEAKTQLFQSNNQDPEINEQAIVSDFQNREFRRESSYVFSNEKDYYDDLARSYFGLSMKKAGWDCMRHYEILAAGSVLLFKNLKHKPTACAPHCPHFLNYSSKEDLMQIVKALLPNGKPNDQYRQVLNAQRSWLLENGTAEAHARNLVGHIREFVQPLHSERPLGADERVGKLIQLYTNTAKEALLFNAMLFKKKHPLMERIYRHALVSTPAIRRFVSSRLLHEKPISKSN
jgi:hypothetical protein